MVPRHNSANQLVVIFLVSEHHNSIGIVGFLLLSGHDQHRYVEVNFNGRQHYQPQQGLWIPGTKKEPLSLFWYLSSLS